MLINLIVYTLLVDFLFLQVVYSQYVSNIKILYKILGHKETEGLGPVA
jgi:hypothetical protein